MNGLETIMISVILSGGTSIGVAWFFRFRTKPKHEKIFDANRQANLIRICTGLHVFDNFFQQIYENINKEFGDLPKEREELVPKPKFIPVEELENIKEVHDIGTQFQLDLKLQNIRKSHDWILENMRNMFDLFTKDYDIYQNYFHDSLLRDVREYYSTTIDYTEWLLKGHNYYSIGIKRYNLAKKIIEYIENGISKNKGQGHVDEFISKWKKWNQE